MAEQTSLRHPIFSALATDIEGFDALVELALDLRWSWNHAADEMWRQMDPALWDLTHNPWVLVQTVSRSRIEAALSDPMFRKSVDELLQAKRQAVESTGWFQETHPQSPLTCVAYFCMEFMLSEALPIYSGGLGNVAGDQLKAASNLDVPVVGVGLLYQQGYFHQVIGRDGAQQAVFPYNDPGQLPITPLRRSNGEWLRLEVTLPAYSLWLRAWQVQVGRVRVYLLDSNDPANHPTHRGITSELFGGGPELRLQQEIVLGLGGCRLLTALGIRPEVFHLNEGHAAFAVLERAHRFMKETGLTFNAALAATRPGNLFTTHTAVPAGFDVFEPGLVEKYLARYAQLRLGISPYDLLALGRRNPDDSSEGFNMAYLAIRGSGAVNGVSRLHGEVSRRLFAPLFPEWPIDEVPIGHVTNGVHMPSWDSAAADDLWMRVCGKDRWLGPTEALEDRIGRVSDQDLLRLRADARKSFVQYVRDSLVRQRAASGEPPEAIEDARHVFDPNALTLGFARRFASYKRPCLLLTNPDRLLRILSNFERPVQLVIAGKAHPADGEGQAMIREWTQFASRPEARARVVFLSDYDMLLTEHLVQGADVWINTPRRPWEACGTSGMKVLVNGGLNISELDGWWAEAYTPEVGWALGDGREHGDDSGWDAYEAETIYDLLEREVIPEFYMRDEQGVPTKWVARMRASMARLTSRFSSNRTVREYLEVHYLPAAKAYRERTGAGGRRGQELVEWLRDLESKWGALRFGAVSVHSERDCHIFEVEVHLHGLEPEAVRVEIYADATDSSGPVRREATRVRAFGDEPGAYIYRGEVPAGRPAWHFTPRLVPQRSGVTMPLEVSLILWQR